LFKPRLAQRGIIGALDLSRLSDAELDQFEALLLLVAGLSSIQA
jgi:hypothetical protein